MAAPPEKGRANARVIALLAESLGVATDAVEVVSGHTSPAKVVEVTGLDDDALAAALGRPRGEQAVATQPATRQG